MGQRATAGIKRCAAVASPATNLQWCSKKHGLRRLPGYRRLNSSISAPFQPLLA